MLLQINLQLTGKISLEFDFSSSCFYNTALNVLYRTSFILPFCCTKYDTYAAYHISEIKHLFVCLSVCPRSVVCRNVNIRCRTLYYFFLNTTPTQI